MSSSSSFFDSELSGTITQAINQMCSLNVPDKPNTPENVEVLEEKSLDTMIQYEIPGSAQVQELQQAARIHGAGAILHSRLVHAGWKFPFFVLTESDDRWLFDVEVRIIYWSTLHH